jgi:hypothetical protein
MELWAGNTNNFVVRDISVLPANSSGYPYIFGGVGGNMPMIYGDGMEQLDLGRWK